MTKAFGQTAGPAWRMPASRSSIRRLRAISRWRAPMAGLDQLQWRDLQFRRNPQGPRVARLPVPQPERYRGHRRRLARLGPEDFLPDARNVRAGDLGQPIAAPGPGPRPDRQEAAVLRGDCRSDPFRLRDQGVAGLARDAAPAEPGGNRPVFRLGLCAGAGHRLCRDPQAPACPLPDHRRGCGGQAVGAAACPLLAFAGTCRTMASPARRRAAPRARSAARGGGASQACFGCAARRISLRRDGSPLRLLR